MSDPKTTPIRCAIYARISDDKRGEGLGVERQEQACRELAERNGWEVVLVKVDNGISAYSGKPRPSYIAMVDAIKRGEVDVVIAWQLDRLYRRMRELEDYIELVEASGIQTQTVMAGAFDLNTAMGRAMARTAVSFATLEVDNSKDRVLSAKLQAAKSGLPSGGNRAYGYEQNGMVIIEKEAAVAREIIDRYIRGDSWNSIALDLNERGLRTATGKFWAAINVRNVAIRPRNISIRVHNDDEYPAQWPPLISRETWDALHVAIKRGHSLHGKRTYARKHLLTGFVYCGLCGTRMHIVPARKRDGSYTPAFCCRTKDHRGQKLGCGKIKRRKDPIEALVIDCILYRLESPEMSSLLANKGQVSTELRQAFLQHEVQDQRLTEILDLYSTGEMTFAEYKASKTIAQTRLEQLRREIETKTSKVTIANIPVGKTIRAAWNEADLKWRRQLADSLIQEVRVHPAQLSDHGARYKNYRQFNPDRIEIVWKA
ncbi:recombinase family protein [Paeniglutamicibacter sp. NPDC091659]|uniref:recombinase family protein n=1 Tax=Paeniglutamicibacter sp. NPDC091659 TaxID=3364389 RepID=UPI00380D3B7E